jgi:hypothetical protein
MEASSRCLKIADSALTALPLPVSEEPVQHVRIPLRCVAALRLALLVASGLSLHQLPDERETFDSLTALDCQRVDSGLPIRDQPPALDKMVMNGNDNDPTRGFRRLKVVDYVQEVSHPLMRTSFPHLEFDFYPLGDADWEPDDQMGVVLLIPIRRARDDTQAAHHIGSSASGDWRPSATTLQQQMLLVLL